MKPNKVFANRVKEVRTRQSLTQQQLAERLEGFSRLVVTRIESGDREVKLDDLIQICAALGVSPIHMLVPTMGKDPIEIADVSLSPREARQWIRGQRPLRQDEAATYFTEISTDELRRQYDTRFALIHNLARSVVEALEESAPEIDEDARHKIADRIDALNRELDWQEGKTEQ